MLQNAVSRRSGLGDLTSSLGRKGAAARSAAESATVTAAPAAARRQGNGIGAGVRASRTTAAMTLDVKPAEGVKLPSDARIRSRSCMLRPPSRAVLRRAYATGAPGASPVPDGAAP